MTKCWGAYSTPVKKCRKNQRYGDQECWTYLQFFWAPSCRWFLISNKSLNGVTTAARKNTVSLSFFGVLTARRGTLRN